MSLFYDISMYTLIHAQMFTFRDAPLDIQGEEVLRRTKIHPQSRKEEEKNSPSKWARKKNITLQVAKNQHWGYIKEEKNHPQRCREEEKKSPPNLLRRKKIISKPNFLPPPLGYLMVRPLLGAIKERQGITIKCRHYMENIQQLLLYILVTLQLVIALRRLQ